LRPRPGQAVVSLSTPAVSLMFFTQFPELQEADISCPVIAGDATDWENLTLAVAAGVLGREEITATLRKLLV
ncbi:MAG: hypothetical protein ACK5VX_04350, partial [Akkermansiaceae bacterium]